MPPFVTTLAIAALIGLVGFLIITFTPIIVSPEISFFVGSILSGIALALVQNKNTISNDQNEDSVEFTTLYVGNLPYRVNEGAVKEHFSTHTTVKSVRLLRDRKTGKRKGFGFVEISSSDTDRVIKALNDSEFEERTLKVRLAKDRNSDD